MERLEDVLTLLREEAIAYIDARFTDPRGRLQHMTLAAAEVGESFFEEGLMFDGSSIAGW